MKEHYSDSDKEGDLLRGMKGANPFSVPDGYFEQLPSGIQSRIHAKRNIWDGIRQLLLKPQYSVAFIAAFAALLITVKQQHQAKTQADNDAIELSSYIHDIDEDLMIESLPAERKSEKQSSIDDYLIENDIDIPQLTEHENI